MNQFLNVGCTLSSKYQQLLCSSQLLYQGPRSSRGFDSESLPPGDEQSAAPDTEPRTSTVCEIVTCASCQDIKLNCVAMSSTGYFFPSLSISRVLLIADKCESCRTSCLREHILFPSSHRSSPPIHLLEYRQGRAKSHRTGANHLKQKSQKQNPNQSPDIKSSVRVYFKHLYFSQLS